MGVNNSEVFLKVVPPRYMILWDFFKWSHAILALLPQDWECLIDYDKENSTLFLRSHDPNMPVMVKLMVSEVVNTLTDYEVSCISHWYLISDLRKYWLSGKQ